MSGLVLKLAPNERVLINGAVIQNGDRRARISIRTPQTSILRLRDAIHPDAAVTPVSRICYTLQLFLSGDLKDEEGRQSIMARISELMLIFRDRDCRLLLEEASAGVSQSDYYRALRSLRDLLPQEARMLGQAV
ncbi:MAG: flagellar biosynthesis repressor FlbT [Paracoccus sp. (in: a-proteobacteria)]|nr:flagellar biosynthesis repressor FlbT [Paracoccus sp. (in: a-proteobacteria)]